MKPIKINNLILGKGKPAICVPLMEKESGEICMETSAIVDSGCDLMEWRIDHVSPSIIHDKEIRIELLHQIRMIRSDFPLLVTYRTVKEGGKGTFNSSEYEELLKQIILSEEAGAIDVEYSQPADVRSRIYELANKHGIKTICSHHDFQRTPGLEEIMQLMISMSKENCDIIKCAFMPKKKEDVLHVLNATLNLRDKIDQPLITMSMGHMGKISRMCGELCGSVLTFAALHERSAPGQMTLKDMKHILSILHDEE